MLAEKDKMLKHSLHKTIHMQYISFFCLFPPYIKKKAVFFFYTVSLWMFFKC